MALIQDLRDPVINGSAVQVAMVWGRVHVTAKRADSVARLIPNHSKCSIELAQMGKAIDSESETRDKCEF